MNEDVLTDILPALDYAAFVRAADGSFTPLAPAPKWFSRLGDVTFPFLGHILEEAVQFWNEGTGGVRDWGPCAEVDAAGNEFHYKVIALSVANRQCLVFHLDTESDRLREVLTKVRREMLAAEQSRNALSLTAMDVRLIREEIHRLLGRLLGTAPTELQLDLLRKVSSRCDELADGTDRLIR